VPRIVGPPNTTFTALVVQARAALERGDLAAAGTALEEAQKSGGPAEPLEDLNAQLGVLAYDREQFNEALGAYLRLRDLRPDIAEGWFNSGLVYQRMANFEEALKAYHEASRLDPESSKIWCNLGTVLFERGEYVEAERAVRRSLALRPEYVRAWDSLAAILGALGKLEAAEHACRQAIQLQPGFHGAWFKLGVIYYQEENFMAAEEAFNATADNPEFRAYILHYRTMMAARRGEIDEAFALLAQGIAADPENTLEVSALREIASALTRLARHVEAATYFGRVVARQPDDFSAWLGKGTAHHRAEEFNEGRAAYERAAEIEPENPMPWHNLGLLASDLGDHAESARCFRRETELAPQDAKAWYDLGVSLQQLGRDSESNAAFEKAETLVHMLSRRSSDLSAALSIVRRLNLGDRVLRTG
jgi:superkiller protein 3